MRSARGPGNANRFRSALLVSSLVMASIPFWIGAIECWLWTARPEVVEGVSRERLRERVSAAIREGRLALFTEEASTDDPLDRTDLPRSAPERRGGGRGSREVVDVAWLRLDAEGFHALGPIASRVAELLLNPEESGTSVAVDREPEDPDDVGGRRRVSPGTHSAIVVMEIGLDEALEITGSPSGPRGALRSYLDRIVSLAWIEQRFARIRGRTAPEVLLVWDAHRPGASQDARESGGGDVVRARFEAEPSDPCRGAGDDPADLVEVTRIAATRRLVPNSEEVLASISRPAAPARDLGPGSVPLSSLTPLVATVGHGHLGRDSFRGDLPIRLDGRTFAAGLDAHAPSCVAYLLGSGFARLRGEAGLWDSGSADREAHGDHAGHEGLVQFRILVDGRAGWTSPPMRWDSPAASYDVDISGHRVLVLEVLDLGDPRWDWSVWANPDLDRATTDDTRQPS